MAGFNNELYVGGEFNHVGVGNQQSWNIARWNSSWAPVQGGLQYWQDLSYYDHICGALTLYHNQLIAGGIFDRASQMGIPHLATWNDSTWGALAPDHGLSLDALALQPYQNVLIAAGEFPNIGNLVPHFIAAWDGTQWSSLGRGLDAAASALTIYRGDVIAAGHFARADGLSAPGIARWDGAAWHPLGTGLDGWVRTVFVWNDVLYAGGEFQHAGGVSAPYLAQWDGTTWAPVPGGAPDLDVSALGTWNGQLIVGGMFTHIGGLAATGIASWDGMQWRPLGQGVSGGRSGPQEPMAVTTYQGDLIVGGNMSQAGGQTVNHIARWDGEAWHDLAGGVGGSFAQSGPQVQALVVEDSVLTVGGVFTSAGGIQARYLARWSGAAWSELAGGVDVVNVAYGGVNALARLGNWLYAGGDIRSASGVPSAYIAALDESDLAAVSSPQTPRTRIELTVQARASGVVVRYRLLADMLNGAPTRTAPTLTLADVRGRVLARTPAATGAQMWQVRAEALPARGVYWVLVQGAGVHVARRFVWMN